MQVLDWSDVHQRIGVFRVAKFYVDEYPQCVALLLSNCVVVKCELLYASEAFVYTALSPLFDVVEPGKIPFYYAVINEEVGSVSFEREDDDA